MSRVYFIRPIGMAGPVKIGTSRTPDRRLNTFETWSPFPLEIAAAIDGDYRLERRFHNHFAADHTHREWFKWSPQLEMVIQAVKAGTFDVSTLPSKEIPLHCQALAGKKRDRSYDTPGFRYERSVAARMQNLSARGMHWNDPLAQEIRCDSRSWNNHTPEQLDVLRANIEPKIAELQARFPGKTRPRRAA